MRIKLFSIFFLIVSSLIINSCKHDPLIPKHTICFESEILPVIVSNCAKSGCHDANSHEEDYNFSSYTGIMEAVNPGNPLKSILYKSITGTFAEKMPPSPATELSNFQIQTIKMWIEQGAENTTNCENNGSSGCDTVNVSYSVVIQPLLANNCTGCHNSGTASGGINLDGYSNIQAYLNSNKINFINAIDYNSSIKMPPSGKLSDCNIAKLKSWINNLYPNN